MLAARFRSWLEATVRRTRVESEMDVELTFHLESRAEHLIRSGIPTSEARRQARLEFGGIEQTKEACRDERAAPLAESLMRDIGYGMRTLRRNPGFATAAAITLALGIGTTTAVFSVVNAVLLRALPYRDPARLVFLYEPNPHFADLPLDAFGPFNADFRDWQKQTRSFAGIALFTTDAMNLSGDGNAVRVRGSRVTGEFFDILGVGPQLGRVAGADDDHPGKGQIAVISNALWRSRFGGETQVLGKELILDAKSYRIVGVMPPGFAFPHGTENLETAGKTTDVWVPWAMTAEEEATRYNNPGSAIGRLRANVSPRQAEAELRAITTRIDPLHPAMFQGSYAVVRPFGERIIGSSRRLLLIFAGAVVLVLLIACSNVAALILARAHSRTREMNVRTALGASRGRLIRQLLAESLCLACAGGISGAMLASAAIRFLTRLNPGGIPRIDETSMDSRVLLFTLCASLITALLSGIYPAWSASRSDLSEALKSAGNRSVKRTSGGFHRGLTIAEIALTVVLLAGSGLLIRSLWKLQSVDKGFSPASTVTMSIDLDERYNTPERQLGFFRTLVDRSNGLPGVSAAAAVSLLPLGGGGSVSLLEVEGHPFDDKLLFEDRQITPRYFSAMGIPLIEGRPFRDDDKAGQPQVAIVNQSFARRYFPGEQAVGKRFHYPSPKPMWITIVAVVGDVRQSDLETVPPMQVYSPLWQSNANRVSLVARTSGLAPDRVTAEMRAVARELDPALAVADVRTMSQMVSEAASGRRFQTAVLATFGAAALFLSLVGLYGLMAWSVQQRTGEMGIRMALGAQRNSVLRLVLKQGSQLVLIGVGLGLASAVGLTRLMSSLLFEVKPLDVPTLTGAALLFCAVGLLACYLPARRATRADPMVSLRYE
jgi:predicted permease